MGDVVTQFKEIIEKARQALEQVGEALGEWLDKQRPRLKPLPVDRPYQPRRRTR